MAKRISKGTPKTKVNSDVTLNSKKGQSDKLVHLNPKNEGQKKLKKAIEDNVVTICIGPPGTGKTFCAVGYALQELQAGRIDKIILTRPYVEAGERLGFLPGSFDEKVAPFMMPMYDVLTHYLSDTDIAKLAEQKKIQHLPFAYMRGVTFRDCIVVADECQNATVKQMHLILTRIGAGSKVVVTGDVHQSDLRWQHNGLLHTIKKLKPRHVDGVAFCHLDYSCVVREKIVNDIDAAFREDFIGEEQSSGLLDEWLQKIDPDSESS